MSSDVETYISGLQNQLKQTEQEKFALSQRVSSMFSNENQQNLVEFQLDLDSIIEKIDHMLRGDELVFDDNGSLIWRKQTNVKLMLFNESGIQEILRILQIYLNRGTILSNYDEAVINTKMYDLGTELIDLIYTKYESMGLDTDEKRKHYSIICREIIDIVHSAYLRAYAGGERESLRTARTVTQSEPMGQNMMGGYNAIRPVQKSLIKPWTWFNK